MTERRIYLMRHGLAEDIAPSRRDADRRLLEEGRRRIERTFAAIKRLDLQVDLLASSPRLRCIETADVLAQSIRPQRREIWPELDCDVDEIALAARIDAESAGTSVMLVGHQPDCSAILSGWLCGRADAFSIKFRKGAIACVRVESLLPAGRATLEFFLPPL